MKSPGLRGWLYDRRSFAYSLATSALLLANAGCTTLHYKELSSAEQLESYGTQPGVHRLSDHFEVRVTKSLTQIYFLRGARKERVKVGTVDTRWHDFSDYGDRTSVYAVSTDGERLLFFDETGIDKGEPVRLFQGVYAADLYLFDARSERRRLIYHDIHRRGGSCADFPPDHIYFGKIDSRGNIESFAYSTEGRELSIEERNRKLRESGQSDKICGPL